MSFVCEFCDSAFSKRAHLEEHERTHTDERPFGCTYPACDAAFNTARHLKRHEAAVHEPQQKVSCPDCGAVLTSKQQLTRHLKEYCKCRPEKPAPMPKGPKPKKKTKEPTVAQRRICEDCNELVAWTTGGGKKEMDAHMATHGGYPCTMCTPVVRFPTEENLRSHCRSKHNPEGPQLCGLCGKVYSSKANLITHIRNVHEGRNDCSCPVCGMTFTKVPNLKRHMKESCGGKARPSSRCTTPTPSTPNSDNSEASSTTKRKKESPDNTDNNATNGSNKRRKTEKQEQEQKKGKRGEYTGALIAQLCGTTVAAVKRADASRREEEEEEEERTANAFLI